MKFRPNKKLLSESMQECVDIPNKVLSLERHLRINADWINPRSMEIKLYCETPDTRIGWDNTYLITAKAWEGGERIVVGFIDQMPAPKTMRFCIDKSESDWVAEFNCDHCGVDMDYEKEGVPLEGEQFECMYCNKVGAVEYVMENDGSVAI